MLIEILSGLAGALLTEIGKHGLRWLTGDTSPAQRAVLLVVSEFAHYPNVREDLELWLTRKRLNYCLMSSIH